jgi:glycosyltransferase involved in cell wall biosynthesis
MSHSLAQLPQLRCPDASNAPVPRVHLSVVIPVYNGAASIGGLLDALLAQCGRRCEIIVVDDCSTDATPAVLAGYAGRDRGCLRCLRTPRNSGPSAARNLGAAAAAGETLLFFDSDDVPAPVLLPTVLATLDRCPDAAFGGYLLAEQALSAVDRSVLKHSMEAGALLLRAWPRHAYAMGLLAGRRLASASSVFIRKSLFDEHGGFPVALRMFEDPELFVRLSACTPFVQIPDVLAIYRIPEAPPAARTRLGAAHPFIHTLRALAREHGGRYRLLADSFAIRMALLARAGGATASDCQASLRQAGVGLPGRMLGAALVIGLHPALLGRAVRVYRLTRRRRTVAGTPARNA